MLKLITLACTLMLVGLMLCYKDVVDRDDISIAWLLIALLGMASTMMVSNLSQAWVKRIEDKTRLLPHTIGRITKVTVHQCLWFRKTVHFEYKYLVNDVDYRGSRFSIYARNATIGQVNLMSGLRGVSNLQELEGRMISVYYDPQNPYKSVINKTATKSLAIFILPSIAVVAACFYVIVSVIQSM